MSCQERFWISVKLLHLMIIWRFVWSFSPNKYICYICLNFCCRELCAVIIYAGNLIKKRQIGGNARTTEAWSTNFGQLLELRSSSWNCFYCALHSRILYMQKSSWKVTQTPPDGCVPVMTRFIIRSSLLQERLLSITRTKIIVLLTQCL